MISTVILTGFLDENLKGGYRLVKSTHVDILSPNRDEVVSYIPVLNWTRDDDNNLTRQPSGKFVLIQGHIECNKKIGLYILVEDFRHFNKQLSV